MSGIYPESMRPTRASRITIVREANEIIEQAAQGVVREGSGRTKMTDLAKKAVVFLRSGLKL